MYICISCCLAQQRGSAARQALKAVQCALFAIAHVELLLEMLYNDIHCLPYMVLLGYFGSVQGKSHQVHTVSTNHHMALILARDCWSGLQENAGRLCHLNKAPCRLIILCGP